MTFSIHSLISFLERLFCLLFFSYVTVGALILLLIIILPCIVRILRQSIQKLSTELHRAVLRKNKKGGDAGSQREELHPWQRSLGRRLGIRKYRVEPQETPCSRASTPKTRVCFMLSPVPLTLQWALPHHHFSRRRS